MQSYRDTRYIATALTGAPIMGAVGGPQVADIHGRVQARAMVVAAVVPAGSRHEVQLTTAPHGLAWQVQSGPMVGYLIPYHHSGWSVNPPGGTPPPGLGR